MSETSQLNIGQRMGRAGVLARAMEVDAAELLAVAERETEADHRI